MAMRRGSKPVIANVARPEGWVDDIVRPIAKAVAGRKAAKAMVKAGAAKSQVKKFVKSGGMDAYRKGEKAAVPSAKKGNLRGTLLTQTAMASKGVKRGVK